MTRQDAKAGSNAEEAETGCSDGERQKGGGRYSRNFFDAEAGSGVRRRDAEAGRVRRRDFFRAPVSGDHFSFLTSFLQGAFLWTYFHPSLQPHPRLTPPSPTNRPSKLGK